MMNNPSFQLKVNGLEVRAEYPRQDIDDYYLPLLRHLTELQKKLDRRIIVFLAAPPGCGKTTLSYFLQQLAEDNSTLIPIQSIGIDGFHFPQKELETMTLNGEPLARYKGCPESFDVEALTDRIKTLKQHDDTWPLYSRQKHDPIEDALTVDGKIVLIEGNYLLLDEGAWAQLKQHCDYSIFMYNDYEVLKKRLVDRKMSGGSSYEEAVRHFEISDSRNIMTVMEHHIPADLELRISGNTIIR